jgi:hypothetical protein
MGGHALATACLVVLLLFNMRRAAIFACLRPPTCGKTATLCVKLSECLLWSDFYSRIAALCKATSDVTTKNKIGKAEP